MKVATLLLLCFCVCAFAATTLTKTSYSLVRPNAKNFVYTNVVTSLLVTAEISAATQNDPLSLSFYTAEDNALTLTPTSSCLDANKNEIFSLIEGNLSAATAITTARTCTYSATVSTGEAGIVYTHLKALPTDTLPEVTSFKTSSSSFTGYWSRNVPRVGDTNVLTIESAIIFAQQDTFVITANSGAPFASASACLDSQGNPLFTVAAQGSRMLFSARGALTSSFSCQVTVVVGAGAPTNRNFAFSAPTHGLSSTSVGFFVGILSSETNFIRIGTYGVSVWSAEPNSADNTIYLAIPASAVRAGDTIKLHSSSWYGGDLTACKYKDGAQAGTIKRTYEEYELLGYAYYSMAMTLASPLQVSAENFVELFCPLTVFDPNNYEFSVSAVSTPEGVYATTRFESDWYSLNSYDFLDDGVYTWLLSYNQDINVFSLSARNYDGANIFIETDVTLRGVPFADLADVTSKCKFSTGKQQTSAPFLLTLVADGLRIQMDSKTLLNENSRLYVDCFVPATAGFPLVVFDNISQRVVAHEPVHAGTALLSFGDGIQTHWMATDAVNGGHPIPFQLNIKNLYTESHMNRFKSSRMVFQTSFNNIAYLSGKSALDMTCSSGSAKVERSQQSQYAANMKFYPVSRLLFTMTGYDAVCSGTAAISYYPSSAASLNYLTVDMNTVAGVTISQAWQNNVKIPTVVTKEQFSFLGAITLGTATNFALGHTLLAKDNEVTFTFDHEVTNVGETCVAGEVAVFHCISLSMYSFKCVKQDVPSTTAACNLSLTFASDFARTISASAAFTGLSDGVVFNPTFKLAASAPAMYAIVPETIFGREMSITYSLPRALTKDDTLMISEIDVASARLEFMRFEPRTSTTEPDSSIVKDGMRSVSLNFLDTNAVTATNFQVIMRHVPKLDYEGEPVPIVVRTWIKDSNATYTGIPDIQPNFSLVDLTISAAPSAFTTLYSVLKIDHPDMVTTDSFTLNGGFVHTGGVAPELRCDGVPAVTIADNKFTLATDVFMDQPCYVVLQGSYTLPGIWSITATTASGSVKVNAYAAAPVADTAVPTATSTSVLVKDVAAAVKLTFPDFTTALAPADNMVFEFNYDAAQMSISQVTCAGVTGTINAGKVSVLFTKDTVPLASYGPATCTIGLTPLAAAAAPVFTNVLLLGKTLTNIALPVFQAAYEPKITIAFPAGPVFKGAAMSAVRYTFDQIIPAGGGTLTFTSKDVAGQLFTITSCSSASASGDVITLLGTALSATCNFAPLYASDAPISLTVTYAPPNGGTVVVFNDFPAPASYQQGTVVTLFDQTADTLTYRFTRTTTEVDPTGVVILSNMLITPTTTIESDCAYAAASDNIFIRYNIPAGVLRGTCDVRVVFKTGYNPDAQSDRMYMYFSPDDQNIYFPVVKGSVPSVVAGFANNRNTFSFANTDSATAQIENVWGVVATSANPIKVRPVADDTAVAGNAVTSTDGRTLTVTFLEGYVKNENNKYSVDLCFLDIPALYNKILQTTSLAAKFTVGSTSTVAYFDDPYIRVDDAATDAVLKANAKYEVAVDMYLAGNQANFVIDYKNTALASVDKCFAAISFDTTDYATPVTFTTKGASIAIALTESITFARSSNVGLRLKCVFNTATAAAIANKVGPFAKTIVAAVKGANNVDFFSAPVPVAIPFVAPKLAVAQIMTFTHSTLFTSTELAALAKQYATGLRKTVAALLDSQVIVTGQKLIAATPSENAVPSPIATQFALAADTTVDVTFTSAASTDAPVTATEIATATPDIVAAFSSYTVTPNTAEEAIVDGECATRCGLGCALCAEGAACSADADCIAGRCNTSGVCGPESEPTPGNDNAASSATISIAVVAVIVAALMF